MKIKIGVNGFAPLQGGCSKQVNVVGQDQLSTMVVNNIQVKCTCDTITKDKRKSH